MQKQSFLKEFFSDAAIPAGSCFKINRNNRQSDRDISYLHYHDVQEFGVCLDGDGIFIIGNRIEQYHAGDTLFIPPGEPHLARSLQGTESRWHWIYVDVQKTLPPYFPELDFELFGNPPQNLFSSDSEPELCRLIRSVGELAHGRTELAALLILFQFRMRDRYGKPRGNDAEESGRRVAVLERLQNALKYFGNGYAGAVSCDRAAKLCNLSPPHFRRLFKQALGCTPLQYVNGIRIQMAAAELEKRRDGIAETAFRSGFRSLSAFNRQFRKQKGYAPRESGTEKNRRPVPENAGDKTPENLPPPPARNVGEVENRC